MNTEQDLIELKALTRPDPMAANKKGMHYAAIAALNSRCVRKQVGAAILNHEGSLLATGFGGSTHGCDVCEAEKGTFTHDTCWSIHAEMRAILQLDSMFRDQYSRTMYTTHGPCDQCLKLMDHVGIRECVYFYPYKTNYGKWSGMVAVYRMYEDRLVLENP